MELGPIQKQWISNLKTYPERQLKDTLGQGTSKKYKACCLGELLICKYRAQKKKIPFVKEFLWSKFNDTTDSALIKNYQSLGLYSDTGEIREDVRKTYPGYSLVSLNDYHLTWPEIAKLVEENPDHFFSKSY